jgi:hypothetical protein
VWVTASCCAGLREDKSVKGSGLSALGASWVLALGANWALGGQALDLADVKRDGWRISLVTAGQRTPKAVEQTADGGDSILKRFRDFNGQVVEPRGEFHLRLEFRL